MGRIVCCLLLRVLVYLDVLVMLTRCSFVPGVSIAFKRLGLVMLPCGNRWLKSRRLCGSIEKKYGKRVTLSCCVLCLLGLFSVEWDVWLAELQTPFLFLRNFWQNTRFALRDSKVNVQYNGIFKNIVNKLSYTSTSVAHLNENLKTISNYSIVYPNDLPNLTQSK